MPLPIPRKGEKKDYFIPRCMRSAVIQREYASQKQQIAVCFSQLRKERGKSAASGKKKTRH